MKTLITAAKIKQAHADNIKTIAAQVSSTIITPEAKDLAKRFGIAFTTNEAEACPFKKPAVEQKAAERSPEAGIDGTDSAGSLNDDLVQEITRQVLDKMPNETNDPETIRKAIEKVAREIINKVDEISPCCNREIDESGIILVDGATIKTSRFEAAGADKNIFLSDVITHRDNAPIAAGIMELEKDSFPWTLTYDEIDVVLDGEFSITINDKIYLGKKGDIFFIPKGSSITFGTPSKTKVCYITYPANWTE